MKCCAVLCGVTAVVLLTAHAARAASAEGHVSIKSPAQGAKVDGMEQTRLVYDVAPGPRGDHVHVYVDGKEVGILRQLAGSYTLPTLAAGARDLCVKVVNRAHVPTGLEQCVKVTVE